MIKNNFIDQSINRIKPVNSARGGFAVLQTGGLNARAQDAQSRQRPAWAGNRNIANVVLQKCQKPSMALNHKPRPSAFASLPPGQSIRKPSAQTVFFDLAVNRGDIHSSAVGHFLDMPVADLEQLTEIPGFKTG